MAASIIDSPQALTPAYNPMYWYFDSTDKTEEGFRYIIEVVQSVTNDVLGTYSLKPIPDSGYGEVDVRKVIQSTLYNDFSTDTVYDPDGHQIDYYIRISEEYFVNVDFTDYGFAGTGTWVNSTDPVINPNGFSRTMLSHSIDPGFTAGDVVNIAQTPSANFRNELEGIHTVLDVFLDSGTYYTVLDLLWIGSGGVSAGVVTYADGLKSVFPSISSLVKSAFKGAFSFLGFRNYDYTDYVLDGSTKKLLTTLPEEVRISRNMPTWLSMNLPTGTNRYVVFTIDSVQYRYAISDAVNDVLLFNALPSDTTIEDVFSGGAWVVFGGGLDLSNVVEYTVQIQTILGVISVDLSEEVTINLYSECDKFTTYDVCFLDRLGSWITLPFNKGDYLTQTVKRQTIRKKYSGLTEGVWGYESSDRGNEIYDVNENITYQLNTGILSQIESQYMRELLSTPQAFVSIDSGEWQAIDITNTSAPLHKKRTQRDRKISLQFKMSVQDEING